MFCETVRDVYRMMKTVGLVRNSRDFSEFVCGQSRDYYRNHCNAGATAIPRWISARIVAALRAAEDEIGGVVAPRIAKIREIAELGDQAARAYYRR